MKKTSMFSALAVAGLLVSGQPLLGAHLAPVAVSANQQYVQAGLADSLEASFSNGWGNYQLTHAYVTADGHALFDYTFTNNSGQAVSLADLAMSDLYYSQSADGQNVTAELQGQRQSDVKGPQDLINPGEEISFRDTVNLNGNYLDVQVTSADFSAGYFTLADVQQGQPVVTGYLSDDKTVSQAISQVDGDYYSGSQQYQVGTPDQGQQQGQSDYYSNQGGTDYYNSQQQGTYTTGTPATTTQPQQGQDGTTYTTQTEGYDQQQTTYTTQAPATELDQQEGTATQTVSDKNGNDLPNTGEVSSLAAIGTGLVSAITGGAFLFKNRKRK